MERKQKYTSYRYLNYEQQSVAELKLSPRLEFNKKINIEKENSIPISDTIHSDKFHLHKEEGKSTNSEPKSTKAKKTYKNRPLRTFKNFIGKSYYNVGYLGTVI